MPVSAPQTQSFNAGWILIFAPIFAAVWAWLGRRNLDPNPMIKFGLALLQVGAGFGILVWGAQFADASWRTPMVFLALAYLLHTTGELCLSPVGLSEMTKLAPMGLLSTLMATWFLGASWAQYLAAIVIAKPDRAGDGGRPGARSQGGAAHLCPCVRPDRDVGRGRGRGVPGGQPVAEDVGARPRAPGEMTDWVLSGGLLLRIGAPWSWDASF